MKRNEIKPRITRALGRLRHGSSDFDLNPPMERAAAQKLRPAAVLIAMQQIGADLHVVLTQRASHLKHHAGQVAFPGGKQEETDDDLVQTALREAREEIGLAPRNVDVLGIMPPHETVTGFRVTPVIGIIREGFFPELDRNEVAEAFVVPFSHVMNTAKYSIQSRRWRGQLRRYYSVPYGPYYIWGATARILRALAEGMTE